MKKLFFVAIAACSLTSCEKKLCWECTYVYTTSPYNAGRNIICDKTKTQIREYEKEYKTTINPTTKYVNCQPD